MQPLELHGPIPFPNQHVLHLLTVLKGLIFSFIFLLCLPLSEAQEVKPAETQAPAASAEPDPLGRNTPRGCVMGFIDAAHQENYQLAARYFQTTLYHTPHRQDEALAQQLMTILDYSFVGSLFSISNKPEGQLNDGLAPNFEKAGKIKVGDRTLDLTLVQMDNRKTGKIWLISSQTLSQIPELREVSQRVSHIEKSLPAFLVEYQLFSMPLWQWVTVVVLFPVAFGAAWVAIVLLRLCAQLFNRLRRKSAETWTALATVTPVTLLLTLFLHYLSVNWLGGAILYREYYTRFMIILTAILIFWLLLRITDRLIGRFSAQADGSCRVETRSLLMLGRRVFKILLFIIIVLLVLRSFGVDVTTALAGLGIGGIILGFGAQKTVENLFGGVSVLTDRVLHVGDFCKVGDQLGTIEDIGLRSTRIRRADRTLVAIPNGTIANATVENYSMREKILFKPIIGVRYETSGDQLRYLLVKIRELLISHPRVESSTARARLIGFGPSSIDLEVFAYILSTAYPEFLAIQEDLLFRILGIIESSGTSFAFPSQTMYVRRDEQSEPERRKAAEDVVRRWREESQLPFPEHDPATIARLENTLTYPPSDSALKREK